MENQIYINPVQTESFEDVIRRIVREEIAALAERLEGKSITIESIV